MVHHHSFIQSQQLPLYLYFSNGCSGNLPWTWKHWSHLWIQISPQRKNISMSCIIRLFRHPFILSDSTNHKQYKEHLLCSNWVLFHFYYIPSHRPAQTEETPFLIMVLLTLRPMGYCRPLTKRGGRTPTLSSSLPMIGPSVWLWLSRPDCQSLGQKQGEISWVVLLLPLNTWRFHVTEELNVFSINQSLYKKNKPIFKHDTQQNKQVWMPKLEFSYKKMNGATMIYVALNKKHDIAGCVHSFQRRFEVETVSEWGWGGGSGKARG